MDHAAKANLSRLLEIAAARGNRVPGCEGDWARWRVPRWSSTGSVTEQREASDADLADIGSCCYDPRSGGHMRRPIPALGDRLMVGLQTLTLPV